MRRTVNNILDFNRHARYFVTIVNQYDGALRYTLGCQRKKPLHPGIWFFIPLVQKIERVDCRTRLLNMAKQEILTNDNIKVTADAIVQFRVADVEKYINNASDSFSHRHELISKRAEVELRELISACTLEQLLSTKTIINKTLVENMQKNMDMFGVIFEAIKINNISFDDVLVRAMAAKTEAKQRAEAKIISAQADVEVSKLYNESSNELENPDALKLRQLETIKQIASEPSSKLIFYPVDALSAAKLM